MNASDLSKDIRLLSQCDLVRYALGGETTLALIVVADNDEEEKKAGIDDEWGDEQEEYRTPYEKDADSGMNGHLYRIIFHAVKNFQVQGQESDTYSLVSSDFRDHHVELRYDGMSFTGPNAPLSLSFDYSCYEVHDEEQIAGPTV